MLTTAETLVERCRARIEQLRAAMVAAQEAATGSLERVHPVHRSSASNLVHYVELRRHDIRALQSDLTALGISSLSHAEQSVMTAVDTVLAVLARLAGEPAALQLVDRSGVDLLRDNADRLLGGEYDVRRTRVMVTLPSEAADDARLVEALVDAGMDVARINCAHDDAAAWRRMVTSVRELGPAVRIAMDLAGPKLRTGDIDAGPAALKVSPRRSPLGLVEQPALVRLVHGKGGDKPDGSRAVPVGSAEWLVRRCPGESLTVVDARGTTRHWTVVDAGVDGCLCAVPRTTYLVGGTAIVGDDGDECHVGELPEKSRWHRVDVDHLVVLTASDTPVPPSPEGATVHRIGCTLPEAFRDCRPGERVWFDDGKIGGIVVEVDAAAGEITVRITDVAPGGAKLHGGKGINLPDTALDLPALTAKDLADLAAVAPLADIVDVSFVRCPGDVEALQDVMTELECDDLGVVLKIETRAAFEHLPAILLQAMRQERVGVMIARGDLAVEVGFERLAEVQEEILWICEAARVPVIWATEVLDSMARTGRPSRAEITDAARAHRAECVMLNKGPHIPEVIRSLTDIVDRMHAHQGKKHHLLRRLSSWDSFPGDLVR